MRILVVGSGGREHALAWKLSQDDEVICAPGNAGIASDVECVPIAINDFAGILNLAKDRNVDLVVVGPEDPLVMGLADALRDQGFLVFGPGKFAAQLEGSKAFSKAMMMRAGVPTAAYQTFIDGQAAKDYCRKMFDSGKQVAVKASGNALGKGVVVCGTYEEAEFGIDQLRALGEAGRTLVIEERLAGREFSLLTLVSDTGVHSLPIAQDYKRINDGDMGPNTGGMGTYSPLDWVGEGIVEQVESEVVLPVVQALKEDKSDYRGVLFSGLMVTPDGPKCIEYNVRFGDPETQSVMMRIGSGLRDALLACAKGDDIPPVEVINNAVTTVVLASGGYPGDYQKGKTIKIGSMPEGVKVFHAGTKQDGDDLVTNGGRVLAVTGQAQQAETSRSLVYDAIKEISFEGMHYRTDIGA